jgi:ArsR family transcriptional regulator, arsenate/arsenite/antimonite-responsive transcriptional repressor
LGLALSTVSKHLKLLEEAGLVNFTKDGLWANYHLADRTESPYAAIMLGNLRRWLKDDDEVMKLVDVFLKSEGKLSAVIDFMDKSIS